MKKIFFVFLFLFGICSVGQSADLRNAVVKIFVTANPVDYVQPWQSQGVQLQTGSGCVIEGNRILTNAHVVSAQTFIQVKKYNSPKKYTAKVVAIGHQCDLAILEIEDKDFFKDITPLPFGDLPFLQDTVYVLGFPTGGDKISITQGVVSRIEVTQYAHSLLSLLAVQIDAAINSGNSGGPVIQDEKLIGIAMQGMGNAQNIGYIIPVPIIKHFLKDVEDGQEQGFPMLGVQFADTESRALQKYFKIKDDQGGALAVSVLPFSPAEGHIFRDDIVLSIDGVKIGEDGTFAFREDERLFLSHLISQKMAGDTIRLHILRQGQEKDVSVKLTPYQMLVPAPHIFENKPPYYIFGGLAFTILTTDLLMNWDNPYNAPPNFLNYFLGKDRLNKDRKKERVVLLGVFPDDVNIGYHGDNMEVVEKVNGKEFNSFEEFVKMVDKKQGEFTIFEMDNEYKMILENKNIDSANIEILKRNNIPSAYSDDVGKWIKK